MSSNGPARGGAAQAPRRAPSRVRIVAVLLVAAAIAVLSRTDEGPAFWLGVALGVVGAVTCVVAFGSARGWMQLTFGVVAFCTCAVFAMQALISLLG